MSQTFPTHSDQPPYPSIHAALALDLKDILTRHVNIWRKDFGEYGLPESFIADARAEGIDLWLNSRVDGEFLRAELILALDQRALKLMDRREAQPDRQIEQPFCPIRPQDRPALVRTYAISTMVLLRSLYRHPADRATNPAFAKALAHALYLLLNAGKGHPAALLSLRAAL